MKPIFLIATALTLAALSCKNKTPSPVKQSECISLTHDQFKFSGIQLATISQKKLGTTLELNGQLEVPPNSWASVSSLMSGYIVSTNILEGKHVQKGEIVAIINSPELLTQEQDLLESQAQLKDMKSQMIYLEMDLNRQKELADQNMTSKKNYQKITADYNSIEGRVTGLEGRIAVIEYKLEMVGINPKKISSNYLVSKIELRAPITGYITKVNTNIGAFVNAVDVLFKIVDNSHLHASLVVFEKNVQQIHVGQQVRIQLLNDNVERLATVFLIAKELNVDRSLHADCHFEKEEEKLIPGSFIKAVIETDSRTLNVLPNSAIVTFQQNNYIFEQVESLSITDSAYHFKMIQIKTGISESGYTEIIPSNNGVDLATKKIVVNGAFDLLAKVENKTEA